MHGWLFQDSDTGQMYLSDRPRNVLCERISGPYFLSASLHHSAVFIVRDLSVSRRETPVSLRDGQTEWIGPLTLSKAREVANRLGWILGKPNQPILQWVAIDRTKPKL